MDSPFVDRRGFLQSLTASAAMLTASAVQSQPAPSPPGDRIRVGLIGVGEWGRNHLLLERLLPNESVEVAAICDVDGEARARAVNDVVERRGQRPESLADYRLLCERDDLAAVIVATPDHWHALCAIAAMESGKHVFCESPLAHSAADAQAIVDAGQLWKRTVQVNLAKRTDLRYRTACYNARFRRLGRLTRVDVTLAPSPPPPWSEPTTPPASLDWDQWLGPAPSAEFSLSKLRGGFRWFSDYSAGALAAGADFIDLAAWGVGLEQRSPQAVRVLRRVYDPASPYDVPLEFHVAFEFDGGLELHVRTAEQTAVRFEGEAGRIVVGPDVHEVSSPELHEFTPTRSERVADYGDLWENFWQSLRFGRAMLINAEAAYRATALVDLAHAALRLNRGFALVEGADQPVDESARRLMARPMRAPHYLLAKSIVRRATDG